MSAVAPRIFALILAVAAVTAGVAAGQTPAPSSTDTISGAGVGNVKLGAKYKTLRKQGLVGKIHHGCELAGPKARAADLRGPLTGFVDFGFKNPRRVRTIYLTAGATARGVGVGSTLAQVQAAFPTAEVDHSGESVFQDTFVKVPKTDGGRIMFAVGVSTGLVRTIGVPTIPFCE
jgi:hypothetical protein